MTVRECLEFSARLKLGGSESQKLKRVDEVIQDLKLTKCQNTFIGGPLLKGVSGGERKRTSIGVELITNPSLIFLDEPTTGLDSYTATQVMRILHRLAESGRTIIQTIHQPNSEIYENFDKLMLLAQGKIIYFNDKSEALPYFKGIGFECPDLTNPADYFMSIMSIESIEAEDIDPNDQQAVQRSHSNIQQTYDQRIKHFVSSYEKSSLTSDPNAPLEEGVSPIDHGDMSLYSQSWCTEFAILSKRNFLSQLRIPQQSVFRVFGAVFVALLCILLYHNIDGSKAGVQNRLGVLFFLALNLGFSGVNNVGLVFPIERPVFLREVNNNMYRVSSYFWAKIVSELPGSLIIPVLQMTIVYFSVGLNTDEWYHYFVHLAAGVLCYNAFTGFGYIIGTAISDNQLVVVLTPVIIVPTMLFAGFFVNQENVPDWLTPLREITIFKYCYQAFVLNEFNDLDLECMRATNPMEYCDPLGDFNSPQTLEMSLLAMGLLWVICYIVSLLIMLSLQ
mmetsp:Transcript_15731/g.26535  ORF Transcript_15731/g.26535 Transcript_15731/m.26535 type:complete len:505 (+) Transcript_15731:642-2156(+)